MAQFLFLAGVTLIIGARKTLRFFLQSSKIRGTALFAGGIVAVLFGWTIIGLCVEAFGFVNLFGDFIPYVVRFLRQIPFIGTILAIPVIATVVDRLAGGPVLPV